MIKTNTVLSIPSAFSGETFPTVNPKNCVMSIVPKNCKIVQKNTTLPELFNLKCIESQHASDPQLQAIYEMVKAKDPDIQQKVHNMNRYYSQFVNDFHVRDKMLRMDDKLVIPNILHKAINNRLHYYHDGKSNMFAAAKDVWFPYIHRNIAAMAENCRECTAAGKNLKTMCSKEDLETISESKEPNESLQLDFWGPINYLKESRMYVIVAEWFAERQWFAEIIARIKF